MPMMDCASPIKKVNTLLQAPTSVRKSGKNMSCTFAHPKLYFCKNTNKVYDLPSLFFCLFSPPPITEETNKTGAMKQAVEFRHLLHQCLSLLRTQRIRASSTPKYEDTEGDR